MKICVFFIILYSSLFSENLFKETRYISAIDVKQYKYGHINYKNNILTLNYTKPRRETIIYEEDKLLIVSDDKTEEYSFDQYSELDYMGLILKAIVNNNYASVDELFVVSKEDGYNLLNAKPAISDKIKYIKIKRDRDGLKQFIIYMINEDTISIEITH